MTRNFCRESFLHANHGINFDHIPEPKPFEREARGSSWGFGLKISFDEIEN